MDNEQPHQELVKCVVVGDTAVGKTRLICARACNKHVSLSQLMTTHVPTVWAIDQYRIYKDVLERSWEVVDGVNVSLRLWDTFGDHEKDRRFAYGRSDVVLLCFSITNPISLRNCGAMWYPEIRRFCPNTPVLLVGCKNDLRYMYRDETYLNYCKDRSPFIRAPRKSDLVMPDQGRALARDFGIYYYETSVFTYYGVNEVFENAIRAALIARRQQRFWMTNLKRVQRPLLQAPFRPPRPLEPEVTIVSSVYLEDMTTLLRQQYFSDMVIICGAKGFPVHRALLAAACEVFRGLLTTHCAADLPRSSSESSMVSSMGEATTGDFNEDTEYLIRQDQAKQTRVWEQIKRRSSCQLVGEARPDVCRRVHHPAILSLKIVRCEKIQHATSQTQTIVTMSKLISSSVMQEVINFIYTGAIHAAAFKQQSGAIGLLLEIRQAAELLGFPELTKLCQFILDQHLLFDKGFMLQFHTPLPGRVGEALDRGWFADVSFELDDGLQLAHRALLMARCDPMKAMFHGHFKESTSRLITFPGVKMYAFHILLCYIYSDKIPPVEPTRCLELLELANRLCMDRLVTLVEARVIDHLQHQDRVGDDDQVVEIALSLLEPVKLHNAHNLWSWCRWRLCAAYDRVCRARHLSVAAREYLADNRWPPVWYVKEYDYYQKCLAEQSKELKEIRPATSVNTNQQTGCLCFASKVRRDSAVIAADASTALCRPEPPQPPHPPQPPL
ncbi:rho-related BTB domain-containing protein 1 isoform X2 [Pieris napi]|uniref:rho-related BTB domain-containing protein 1 isoform X1 n=1 Tax=Pieris napi TaxID=78633 RepID=UPI001FBB68FB|nr:rho-related BTB domain-containing protein 1 isoform X1 [Pieris napi]XP_047512846.1 rho-related BTB domain-containing protein 1 isoform X2 [Pieris napi]XP_047512847.1 rho-related BTB domain-containing protein 1 isoform X2 [Pieris napi]